MKNYGYWNYFDNYKLFNSRFEERTLGANFYPKDISKYEFETLFQDSSKTNPLTIIKRNNIGELITMPYHKKYKQKFKKITELFSESKNQIQDNRLKFLLSKNLQYLYSDSLGYYNFIFKHYGKLNFILAPIGSDDDKFMNIKKSFGALIFVNDENSIKKFNQISLYLYNLKSILPGIKKHFKGKNSIYALLKFSYLTNAKGCFNKDYKKTHITNNYKTIFFLNVIRAKYDKIVLPLSKVSLSNALYREMNFNASLENTILYNLSASFYNSHSKQKNEFTLIKRKLFSVLIYSMLMNKEDWYIDFSSHIVTYIVQLIDEVRKNNYEANEATIILSYLYDKEVLNTNAYNSININFHKIYDIIPLFYNEVLKEDKDFIEKYIVMPDDLKKIFEEIKKEKLPEVLDFS